MSLPLAEGLHLGPLTYIFTAVLGLIIGSFVTALSYRLPRGEDFVSGRSRCPSCRTALSARDLFPVFSWLMSRGRCRHCGVSVSARYPLTEAVCAILFVAVVWGDGSDQVARVGLMWLLSIGLLCLSVIDLELRRLPNSLILFVFIICAGLAWVDGQTLWQAGTAGLIAFSVAAALRVLGQALSGQTGLGWGDVKLATAISIPLGFGDMTLFVSVLGGATLCIVLALGWTRTKAGLPLGPALCAAAYVVLI